MALQTTESEHNLSGDWTISGVVGQLDLLSSSLNTMESAGKKRVHIDCEKIDTIDMNGLRLLYVWLELAKMLGMEAQLTNLPVHMHQSISRFGVGQCFPVSHQDAD